MARAKRWTIPFKSLNGTDCRIDIYDEGWSGSVTEISTANNSSPGYPQSDPIYYEEESDENLLLVVRYKTGYINLVETSYNSLIDLYPETNTEHYVEFYYGSRLDFVGYIQAQAFDNSFTALPREISLPIVSPLGLCDGIYFDAINPPETLTMGGALKKVITKLNAAYTKILYPMGGASDSSAFHLYDEFNSLCICPWNDDFNKNNGTVADLYSPEKLQYFLEAFCNAYGWMVHDTPDALVFTDFHYAYQYKQCPVADLDDMSGETTYQGLGGGTVLNITDCFDFCDDDGKESVVMPLHTITKNLGGEKLDMIEFPYDRMRLSTIDDTYTYKTAELAPVGPEVTGMVVPGFVNSSGKTQSGVSPCVIGSVSSAIRCLTWTCPNGGYSDGTAMFTWNIYEHPEGDMFINIPMTWGPNVNNLANEPHDFKFKAVCTCGNWIRYATILVNQDSAGGRINLSGVPRRGVLSIQFMHAADNGMEQGMVYSINELSLKRNPDEFHNYLNDDSTERKVVGNNASNEDGMIELPISYEIDNSGLIGDDVLGTLQYYQHMLLAQNRIQAKFLAKSLPANLYIPKWSYWVTSWRWRMIAVAFHPWDDLYKLTLHRSSTIETPY